MPLTQAERAKRYYNNPDNKGKILQRAADKRERNRKIIREAKSVPCADCQGVDPYYVMDFDHVRGIKVCEISKMLEVGLKKLLNEIAKCDVVCANCHRLRTFSEDDL